MITLENSKNKKMYAYKWLKNAILTNKYPPEKMLVERELCRKLGVSRTPIREALRMLASEGLVEAKQNRGVFVTRIDYKDFISIYEFKEALERMSVRLCIEKGSEDTLKELERCIKEHEQAYKGNDLTILMNKDIEFHVTLVKGSQNKRIIENHKSLYDLTRRLFQIAIEPSRLEYFIKQHKRIIESIKDNNKNAAEKAVSDHINDVTKFQKERIDKYF